MKLLTFAVPCYNSEAYMENCIDCIRRTIRNYSRCPNICICGKNT